MGIFKKIKDAKIVGGNGNYFGPGEYKVQIVECKEIESQNTDGVSYFCVETVVLWCKEGSRLAAPQNSPPGTEGALCKRGDRVTWLINMTLKPSLGNVKQFMLACDPDGKEEDIDEAFCDLVVSSEQPMKGLFMKVSAWNKPTREGGDFTRLNWEFDHAPPAPLNSAEQKDFDDKRAAAEEAFKAQAADK